MFFVACTRKFLGNRKGKLAGSIFHVKMLDQSFNEITQENFFIHFAGKCGLFSNIAIGSQLY